MALNSREKESGNESPVSYEDPERSNTIGDGVVTDDVQLVCPSSTTDSKLMARIDFHVIPFLCIMYLLAFLGMLLSFFFTMSQITDSSRNI
ncbi:hypothetical protein QX201_007044 [Fusarium graminearum]